MNTQQNAVPAEAEVSFSRILVLSVLVAAPWAALGFMRGVTGGEYVALFAGCAFSLLLVQMTATSIAELPSFGPRVLTPLAVAAPVVGYAAFWLMRNTHHRPLGAVTWAVFAAVAWLAVAALLSPVRVPARDVSLHGRAGVDGTDHDVRRARPARAASSTMIGPAATVSA